MGGWRECPSTVSIQITPYLEYSFYIGTSRVAIGPPLHTHFESLKTVLKSPLKSKTFCPSAMYTTGFAIWKVIFINLWIMEPVSFELLAITSLLI